MVFRPQGIRVFSQMLEFHAPGTRDFHVLAIAQVNELRYSGIKCMYMYTALLEFYIRIMRPRHLAAPSCCTIVSALAFCSLRPWVGGGGEKTGAAKHLAVIGRNPTTPQTVDSYSACLLQTNAEWQQHAGAESGLHWLHFPGKSFSLPILSLSFFLFNVFLYF